MKGDEVVNGDVLVVNNRIQSVGKGIKTPAGTKVIDVSGKTIIPGFVDVHSHMWPSWGIHKTQVWIYAANLAYGVTTTRDPQTATSDVLTYADMVEAGHMVWTKGLLNGSRCWLLVLQYQRFGSGRECIEAIQQVLQYTIYKDVSHW